jgi:hypothetical protein
MLSGTKLSFIYCSDVGCLMALVCLQIRVAPTTSGKDLCKHANIESLEPLLRSPELEDLEKSGRIATKTHLIAMAQDAHIRSELASQEMQAVIASIDGAPAREAALAKALGNPSFAAFCSSILDQIPP